MSSNGFPSVGIGQPHSQLPQPGPGGRRTGGAILSDEPAYQLTHTH